ncbi:MAG: hypothetical protein AAGI37_15685 [Planctomycetota bacterium]
MKSFVSMLFVLATALLLTSPAQARYADGMNTYAAYHVMRGGVDPSGMISFKMVGDGAQTVTFGNHLSGYLGVTVHPDEDDLDVARLAGGATLITQRDTSWKIEDCEGKFKGSEEATNWHYDPVPVNEDGELLSAGAPYRGTGGPVGLADKTAATAYISFLQFSSQSMSSFVIENMIKEAFENGADRETLRSMRKDLLGSIDCTKGEIDISIESKFYFGDNKWARKDFNDATPGTPPGQRVSGAEFVHKPWTAEKPEIFKYASFSKASLSIKIKWDACGDSLQLSVSGDSGGLTAGPQRVDIDGVRQKNPNSTVWTPNDDGGWTPNSP